jgi:hypothetical protein
MTKEANLELWHRVQTTDPKHTKSFKRKGGFSGTAIKPFWLIYRATEEFGKIGVGWGFSELENKVLEGIWFSKVQVWYMHDGKPATIEQWGATEFLQKRQEGSVFVDEEAAKKSVTDAVTKCLSYLGFAADVHMGLFDDSKYVEHAAREYADATAPHQVASPFKTAAARNTFCKNTISSYENCLNLEELKEIARLNAEMLDKMKASGNEHDQLAVDELRKQYTLAVKRFKDAEAVRASYGDGFADTPTDPSDILRA